MACFNPVPACRYEDGSVRMVSGRKGEAGSFLLPCGRCQGCRLESSRQWAVRCVHEASLWPKNSFVTLTYSPEHLPPGGSLHYRDFQLFIKRLRKSETVYGKRDGRRIVVSRPTIRFFMCGEYGETYGRAHYHALLFNYRPEDLVPINKTLFDSPKLAKLWRHGAVTVGDVTWQSASYVARYIFDKLNGELGRDKYAVSVDDDGVITFRDSEFCQMSRRPGIGAGWFERFHRELWASDSVVIDGREQKIPKFYDKRMRKQREVDFAEIVANREFRASLQAGDNTARRLADKAAVLNARLSLSKKR